MTLKKVVLILDFKRFLAFHVELRYYE